MLVQAINCKNLSHKSVIILGVDLKVIKHRCAYFGVAFQNFCGNSYTFQEALPCKPYIVLWIYAFDFGVLIVIFDRPFCGFDRS